MRGASVTRERIACGAVGVATPSTRRASTLCHVCHRGHMCRGWGSRGHTLRGDTTSAAHRCVRCGERDVHGVRHERAPGTSKGGRRRPSRATQERRMTADLRDRRSNLRSLPPPPHTPASYRYPSPEHGRLPALSTTSTLYHLSPISVPITTDVREHDRLPALSQHYQHQLYPYLGGASSHASFVSD